MLYVPILFCELFNVWGIDFIGPILPYVFIVISCLWLIMLLSGSLWEKKTYNEYNTLLKDKKNVAKGINYVWKRIIVNYTA